MSKSDAFQQAKYLIAALSYLQETNDSLSVDELTKLLSISEADAEIILNQLLELHGADIKDRINLTHPLVDDTFDESEVYIPSSGGLVGRAGSFTEAEIEALYQALQQSPSAKAQGLAQKLLPYLASTTQIDAAISPSITKQMALIAQALIEEKTISCTYYNPSSNITTSRLLFPITFLYYEKMYYLRAFDLKKRALRTFHLARMADIVLGEKYDKSRNYYLSQEEASAASTTKLIKVTLTKPELVHVFEGKTAKVVQRNEHTTTCYFPYIDAWLIHSLAALGERCIIEHDELKEKVAAYKQDYLFRLQAATQND